MKKILSLLLLVGLTGCVTVTEGDRVMMESDPETKAESRIALGLGYMGQGDKVKALDNFQQAYKHAPNYYRAQITLAHYYEQVGNNSRAEEYYQQAERQHGDNGDVLHIYATYLCKRGEYQQADTLFMRAIKLENYVNVADSYENAAYCALKSGNKEQAKYYFARTLDYDPNRPRSVLQLSKLEIDDDELRQARGRLVQFHMDYGLHKTSLKLLIELETKADNQTLVDRYSKELARLNRKA